LYSELAFGRSFRDTGCGIVGTSSLVVLTLI